MEPNTATIKYYLVSPYVAHGKLKVNEIKICDNANRTIASSSDQSFRCYGRPTYPLADDVVKADIRISIDEVDKLIAQFRLISATLMPYFCKNQLTLVTPLNDENGVNGTYQLVRYNNGSIISILWYEGMKMFAWKDICASDEICPYDANFSKKITNAIERYKKIFDELVEKYAHR